MDVGAAFIANGQTPEAAQPRQRPLHHPAMATQALAGVNAFPRNAHLNVPAPQGCSAARVVVALIRMEFGGALAPLSGGRLDQWDGIEQSLEDDRVMAVGPGQEDRERDAGSVDHNMALRARFAAIRRIRSGARAPLLAGMLAESSETRLQSIWSASPKRSRSSRWSRSHTPASCQS